MVYQYDELEQVERPSRYLGGEVGAVIKDEADLRLKICLAFPDVYEIGMSHLGLKILYGMINQRPDFWAERVMAVWPDREQQLRQTGRGLRSLESGRFLADFDVIGFSLQYELTYTNILTMLELGGIPLAARDRGPEHPLIIGGGPNAYNPEPLADFFDFFYLGDAEAGLMDILDETARWKAEGAGKEDLLAHLAGRPGLYVPSFFEPVYDDQGRLREIAPKRPGYSQVERVVIPDLNRAYFPGCPIVPFIKTVHDRVAVEIARGCTRGCRFCQAGYIYRPVRERSPERILALHDQGLAATGQDEASFLSLSAGDYTLLNPLMKAFMDAHGDRHVALSLPSLRVKSLNTEMMQQIKRVRKTGFTLAPEAGTQRLRDVINKDLTEDDLFWAGREVFRLGWRVLKLYFMVGLPTETENDVLAIADLARRLKGGTRGQINVSFAVFVPKVDTPFQWEPMLNLAEMRSRMGLLLDQLRKPGLKPKWNEVEASLLEGLLARGDRRLGPVIRRVQAKGARFDAWTEQLRLDYWLEALAEAGINPDQYLRARAFEEVLPWSHLRTGVRPEYLWQEREKAYLGITSPDCREGACGNCGACDFSEIRPWLNLPAETAAAEAAAPLIEELFTRFRINYIKDGAARLLSHLEVIDVFLRAFRRGGLSFRMTQGFHPQPRIVFASPLSVGVAGLDEYLEVEFSGPPQVEEIRQALAAQLPAGFAVRGVVDLGDRPAKLGAIGARYRLESGQDLFDPGLLEKAWAAEHLWVTKKSKKGFRKVDLKPLVNNINILTARAVELNLIMGPEGTVRPRQAVEVLFGLDSGAADGVQVFKTRTLLTDDTQVGE
jgi:radical SAM family uncharacterized protein/radical SAM-linked protein